MAVAFNISLHQTSYFSRFTDIFSTENNKIVEIVNKNTPYNLVYSDTHFFWSKCVCLSKQILEFKLKLITNAINKINK